jgi:putrescine aminotransferase
MNATPATLDVEDLYRRHLSAGRARVASIVGGQVELSSRGAIVIDARGEEYLDCGGYGVFLLGHGHPRVVAAVCEQVERHALSTRLFLDPIQATAARALASVTPPGLDRVYFGTSGADVVEAAIKLARLHGIRHIVGIEGGFHGKSFGALSVSGNPTLREPFAPLLPHVQHVPFGDADALSAALARVPGRACVIAEPVQAEGGVRIPPTGHLAALADVCRAYDALLIIDEIATGLGRVGAWWRVECEGVQPDVMLVGKPLGGGVMPVGALVATAAAFAPLDRDPFIHSATFAGSPAVMAAVTATIEVLHDERIPQRAAELGLQLGGELRGALAAAQEAGVIVAVRAAGLLIGLEFATPALAGEFEIELVQRRVIPNHCMNQHCVVRYTPPALLDQEQVRWLVQASADAAEAVLQRRQRRARSSHREPADHGAQSGRSAQAGNYTQAGSSELSGSSAGGGR